MLATNFCPQSRQPCGQPGQIGISRRQMLAFLPIESFIDEQRQSRRNEYLDGGDQGPQQQEATLCAFFVVHMPLDFLKPNYPGKRCRVQRPQARCYLKPCVKP